MQTNSQSTIQGGCGNSTASAQAENSCGEAAAPIAKQATGAQFVTIVFLLAMATKMFLLPIYLIRATGRDGYIALAIGGGLDLISLGAMMAAMFLSKDADFFTLIKGVLGKVGSKIFVGIVGLFLFFKLNISVAESLTFYADNVFTDFDSSIMIIILLVFLSAVGAHTLRALCRLSEIVTPIILVCVVVLTVIVIMTGFDLANILPVMRTPDFAREAFGHAAWIGDFTPLIMFIGRTKLRKRTGIAAATSGVIGTAVAVFFALVLCAAFGNVPVFVDSGTNFSSILQYTLGNVYGRIDLFSSVLWSTSAFIETALFFYATVRCFSYVIGRNAHLIMSIGVSVALYFLQVFAFTDPTIFGAVVTSSVAAAVSAVFTFVVPASALIAAAVHRKKHGEVKKSK